MYSCVFQRSKQSVQTTSSQASSHCWFFGRSETGQTESARARLLWVSSKSSIYVTCVVFVCAWMLCCQALAGPAIIPLSGSTRPANDLVDANREFIAPGDAAYLKSIDPQVSWDVRPKMLWQDQKYKASDADKRPYPQAGEKLRFVEHGLPTNQLYSGRVQAADGKYYRFVLDLYMPSSLARAALLRKLGYFVPSPQFYPELEIEFESAEAADKAIDHIGSTIGYARASFAKRNWFRYEKGSKSVVFSNVALEPAKADYFDFHWGQVPILTSQSRLLLMVLSKYRSFRSVLVPLILTAYPESLKRMAASVGYRRLNQIVLSHPRGDSFIEISKDDIDWILDRMAGLSQEDWREIADSSHLPAGYKEYFYRRLLHRSQDLFALFERSQDFRVPLPTLQFTTTDGLVVQGEPQKKRVAGYPQDFLHKDRESPFDLTDFVQFLKIEGISTLLKEALSEINEELVVRGQEHYAKKFQEELQEDVLEHIQKTPQKRYVQEVDSWGGWTLGFPLRAARHLTTGTFYESNAPIQLVDSFSFGGQLGLFRNIEGYTKVFPGVGGSISAFQSYSHVRPLDAVEDSKEVSWLEVFVPYFLSGLSSMLEADHYKMVDEKGTERTVTAFDRFMAEVRPGEVINIVTSIGRSGYLSMISPLDLLVGIDPLGFVNHLALGVEANWVNINQTQIARTDSGLQVSLRRPKKHIYSGYQDLNFYLKIMSWRASLTPEDVETKVFVIDYDPERGTGFSLELKEQLDEQRNLAAQSLYRLLKFNDSSWLEENFSDFEIQIQHKLRTKENRLELLNFVWDRYSEWHEMKLKYPTMEPVADLLNKPFQTDGEASSIKQGDGFAATAEKNTGGRFINVEDPDYHLASYRKASLQGEDKMDFLFDVLEGVFERPGTIDRISNPNPANAPLGSAYWRTVRTDGDLTEKSTDLMPQVSTIQHVWGGWSIGQEDLYRLFRKINRKFSAEYGQDELIDLDDFVFTEKMDFYRITVNLAILDKGLEKLKEFFWNDEFEFIDMKGGDSGSNLFFKFFEALTEVFQGPYRPSDGAFYHLILSRLGDGDAERGLRRCQQRLKDLGPVWGDDQPGAFAYGSNYPCYDRWMLEMFKAKREFSEDPRQQIRWLTETLLVLEERWSWKDILDLIERENYVLFGEVYGFRQGDEDGDLIVEADSFGEVDRARDVEFAGGLFKAVALESGLSIYEVDRSNGGFR